MSCPRFDAREDRSGQGDPRRRVTRRDGARAGRQADRAGVRRRGRAGSGAARADHRRGVRRGRRDRRRRRAFDGADLVVSVQPLDADADPTAARAARTTISFLPVNQEQATVIELRDAGVTAHAVELIPRISRAQSMDAPQLAGPGLRLPLRDRRGRHAPPLLPAEHDRRRHRPGRRGRRPRRRRRRPPGDRDRQAPRRRRPGVRRARGRRGGDPVDGRQVDRPRPRHPRGRRWLRPRDDRGPRRPPARAAHAVHRRRRRPDHHRRRAGPRRRRCWSPARWSSR